MSTPDRPPLRPTDFALLAALCGLLFAFPIAADRTLTTHETVHCQNAREMRADGDWVIPHYGGRPWLERPPLPFWLTIPVVAVLGDRPAAYRLPPALAGLACVLLTAGLAGRWYGRGVGLLSGLALATVRQLNHYATAPECDVFLCAVVTAAVGLCARLEVGRPPDASERWLVGPRPWALSAFFVALGAANLVKGLFFGDALILAPVGAFLLWGDDPLGRLRRYVWLPGWLLFAVVGSAWAVAAYLRYPDVVGLWLSDYGGRLSQGFMREPAWYYLPHLPWALFPWPLPALLGLWLTRREALLHGRTPERFLWCWALAPLVVLSLPQGKHQHYLLHALAPWAILAAIGMRRMWRAVFGVPRLAAWHAPAVGVGVALLVAACWALHLQPRLAHDRYAADLAFAGEVRRSVPNGAELLVIDDWGPLDASWMLFYLEGRARLLHNVSFLRDERHGEELYVVARRLRAAEMTRYGRGERLLESAASRSEPSLDYRLGLYRLRLRDGLSRRRGGAYISPLQATGRALGPDLDQSSSSPLLCVTGR